jgi:hypothetical protein
MFGQAKNKLKLFADVIQINRQHLYSSYATASQHLVTRQKGLLACRSHESVVGSNHACMGRLGFEPRTNRLKAECSTAELATPKFTLGVIEKFVRTMGRLGFEPRTNRLKAECSTAELATPMVGKDKQNLSLSLRPQRRLSNGLIL